MPIPNFQDLYDDFRAHVQGDAEGQDLTDFTPGSMLDGYAMVAAVAAQRFIRRVSREALRYYLATAEGGDLTKLVRDRYDIERQDNETDAELRQRVKGWLKYAGAGTRPALEFYVQTWTEGVESATFEEDLESGATTVKAKAADGYTASDVQDDLDADLDYWRPLAGPVTIKVS